MTDSGDSIVCNAARPSARSGACVLSSTATDADSESLPSSSQVREEPSLPATPTKPEWEWTPFDVEPAQLTLPSCSPSMFVSMTQASPGHKQPFRWSIDQMAVLWPANIDEESSHIHREQATRNDELYEEKSQQAIEAFFSRHDIVPSPWEPQDRRTRLTRRLQDSGSGERFSLPPTVEERRRHKTVWSQTDLSIPPDADITAALAQYFTFDRSQEHQTDLNCPASNPNSTRDSMRRKLFCNAVENRARTPERTGSQNMSVCSSPIPLAEDKLDPCITPVLLNMCSSPIGRVRCSEGSTPDSEGMQLSPICRQRSVRNPGTPLQRNLFGVETPKLSFIRTVSTVTRSGRSASSRRASLIQSIGISNGQDAMATSPCRPALPDNLESNKSDSASCSNSDEMATGPDASSCHDELF
ncbi:protein aurora borealis [Ixodes scapularis]